MINGLKYQRGMLLPIGFLTNVGGGGGSATLTLNDLSSNDSDSNDTVWSSTAGIKVRTNGDVEERLSDTYTAQNSGTEWIDDAGATSSLYEAYLTKTAGSGTITAGPSLDNWHTIDTDLVWTMTYTTVGTFTWVGTLTIREIANTGNTVSCQFILFCNNTDTGGP